mmetsp:Transcript_20403/g.38795  ORF Transcript_20403/g.38795 Transcript_20403/m.38795 type:complete len:264 (+) Transcript_20403:761-1552(+)
MCHGGRARHQGWVGAHALHRTSCYEAFAHESTNAHRSVVRASNAMPNAGINAPKLHMGRDGDVADDLSWTTHQRQQLSLLAAHRRHLVHHPARGTYHQILHHLAQHRQVLGLHVHLESCGERGHGGHFHGCRGGDALALGHLGVHQHADPVLEPHSSLAHQHQHRARDVRRPVASNILLEEGLCRLVRNRFACRLIEKIREVHVKGRRAVGLFSPKRHNPQSGHEARPMTLVALAGVLPSRLTVWGLPLKCNVTSFPDRHLQH